LDLLTDAVARLELQFEFLLNACGVEVLLENEQIALVVEHDELRLRERND